MATTTLATLPQTILGLDDWAEMAVLAGKKIKAYVLWASQYAEFQRLKQIEKIQDEVAYAEAYWPKFNASQIKDAMAYLDS